MRLSALSVLCLCTGCLLGLLAGCQGARSGGLSSAAALSRVPTPPSTLSPVPAFTPTRPVLASDPVPAATVRMVPTWMPTIPPAPNPIRGIPVNAWTAGSYENQADHHRGRYRLKRTGAVVRATFSTAGSLMQNPESAEPELLFTVPPDFRPATTVAWVGLGQSVTRTGVLPVRPSRKTQRFHLRITPDGTVRVRYDHVGNEGGGAYLSYTTTLVWLAAGAAPPPICNHPYRSGIMTQLEVQAQLEPQARGQDPVSCDQVTWEHLARIRRLGDGYDWSRLRDPRVNSLAVLRGLEELALFFRASEWEPVLLAATPQLRKLWVVSDSLTDLSPGLLLPTPHLTKLELDLDYVSDLPPDFLDYTPQLTDLTLNMRVLTELPPALPALGAQLQHLVLLIDRVPVLPADFLAAAPHLVSLELYAPRLTALPTRFLADVPHLESVGLLLPNVQLSPTQEEWLGALLEQHSRYVVVVSGAEIDVRSQPGFAPDTVLTQVPPGADLWVQERYRDEGGETWLRVLPNTAGYYPEYWGQGLWIEASVTEPTMQSIRADIHAFYRSERYVPPTPRP